MRNQKRVGWWLGVVLLLAGCGGMVGAYRGPEPFGGKDYVVAPPSVQLGRVTRVVLLVLKDERPHNEHELDWVRQGHPFGDTVGQPREVRTEFDRAIKSGLRQHRGIALVAPETFAQTREADLVISGRILRCDAEKKIGWSTADFHGRASIEILLRDGHGKALAAAPVVFSVEVKRPLTRPYADTHVDEIQPGIAAAGMEAAIAKVVEAFLGSRELGDALKSVSIR